MPGRDHLGSSGQNWSAQAPSEPWPHHGPRLTSRALVPDEDHPGFSRKNWFAQAHQQPRPPNTESLQGGCPVEEEFPPNWVEFFPFLPSTPGAPARHLHHQSISRVSCYEMHSGRRSLTSGGPLGAQFHCLHGRRPHHGLCCCL
jgi:hypothetical protein